MMKPSKEQTFFIKSAFLLGFLFVFWFEFAPSQLGGPLTYVIVNGISMEPKYHLGDLVLVRKEAVYGPGDAVVYSDPNMGQFVFHRIIGLELDRFILQGDNNGWLDSYHPAQNEIVGKLWLHIPKFGKVIEWVRMPIHAALMAGLFGVLLMSDMFKKTPQTRRGSGLPSLRPGASSQLPLAGFGFLTILFLALGVYSFTRPVDLPATTIPYQQTGDYYYSATGTPGVYDSDLVQTGEPVFPKLTCFLNVGFTYAIAGENLQNVSGTQSTYARIMDVQSGWQRTIPLYPETSFSGASNFTMSTLDLCEVESLVNLVEAQAGLKQISYTLEIVSEVKFTANVGGAVFSDTFSPVLTFNYDKIHFFLAEAGDDDPLHSVKSGMAGSAVAQANSISLMGFAIPVWMMRLVSMLGFLVSALGLGMAGMGLYRTASETEEGLIRLKYGGMLVNVHEQNLEPYSATVDVNSMDDLARLADRYGGMILHMKRNFLHYYFVQSRGAAYRYVITSGKKGVSAVDEQEYVTPAAAQVSYPDRILVHESINSPVEPAPVQVKRTERRTYDMPPHGIRQARATKRQTPARIKEPAYVIDTGEIEFYIPEQNEPIAIEQGNF